MLLSTLQAQQILKKYKIDFPKTIVLNAKDIEKASKKAVNAKIIEKGIGFPLVLKIDSPEIIHKTDKGMVFLNMASCNDLFNGIKKLKFLVKLYNIQSYSFIIQEQVKGIELFMGMKHDAVFGKAIVFGLGGVFVELCKDVSMRILPLKKKDCYSMIEEIKSKKIFSGFRNYSVDKGAVAGLLLKLSKLSMNEKNITEIDFNPVVADGPILKVADARIIQHG